MREKSFFIKNIRSQIVSRGRLEGFVGGVGGPFLSRAK